MKTSKTLAGFAAGCLALAGISLATAPAAQAKGCIKGALVGGVAGHLAGHHGLMGAAAGCAIGHHMANKASRTQTMPTGSDTTRQPSTN